jgi:hypothetical protein
MSNGDYITTKWVVLLWVPLLPLGSVRVIEEGPLHSHPFGSKRSMTTQPVSLDLRMVALTYGLVAGIILFIKYGYLIQLVERISF